MELLVIFGLMLELIESWMRWRDFLWLEKNANVGVVCVLHVFYWISLIRRGVEFDELINYDCNRIRGIPNLLRDNVSAAKY